MQNHTNMHIFIYMYRQRERQTNISCDPQLACEHRLACDHQSACDQLAWVSCQGPPTSCPVYPLQMETSHMNSNPSFHKLQYHVKRWCWRKPLSQILILPPANTQSSLAAVLQYCLSTSPRLWLKRLQH